jgi:predicted AlkP superfamily phosphohydrolase/phosphomutase
MTVKTLMILLDSADPMLLRDWAAGGQLPVIASILETGDHRGIENMPGFGSGVYWPSIFTGLDASFHGRYYKVQPQPPDYVVEDFLKNFHARPFWAELEEQGRQIAVLDAPESPIAGLQKGIEVYDWLSHRPDGPASSLPPTLISDLKKRFGDDPFEGNSGMAFRRGMSEAEVIRRSTQRTRIRTDATLDLMSARDWDLFLVNYSEPHCIGHLLWHLHEGKSQTSAGSDESPLLRCYREIDTAIGRLLPSVEPGGKILVVLGPGMESMVTFNHLLPEILRSFQGMERKPAKRFLSNSATRLMVSGKLPNRLSLALRQLKRRLASKARGLTRQRYYAVPNNDNAGAVRISLRGREPGGLVEPGAEYDALCDEISKRLLAIRDAAGEKPIVSEIVKVRSDYDGPNLDLLPDLFVIWNREAAAESIKLPDIGTMENTNYGVRSGDHTQFGMLISNFELPASVPPNLSPMEVTGVLTAAV